MPPLDVLQNVVLMSLPTHIFAETFSIIVSILVFTLVFSTTKEAHANNPIILASAFLVVGLLDFAHTLSYVGMPDFVTPGSPDKSIYFWLIARYVAAIALFFTALLEWKKISRPPNRYWLLLASIVFTGVVYWIGLYHLDTFPRTFIEGQGLTQFKVVAEYGIIAILLVPAVLFYLKSKKPQPFDAGGLYAATVITILSELCFTLYANLTGLFILLGHIYKVIAYIYIFKAIFVFVVREPYQKLYESEQYNRNLFETSSIGLVLCRMDGSLVDINQSYANIIGRNIDEAKQLTYWQITPKEYVKQERRQLESLKTNRYYGPYEKEYLHKDGRRVPVRLSGSLIERNGETFIWSCVEDISGEIAAERARYASEQHFRQLVEHISEVFWLIDINRNKMIYISPTYETIWGRTCESLYANPTSFLEAIHEDDRERGKHTITPRKEGPYYEEFRIVQPNGSVRWIKSQSYPIQSQNGVIYRIAGIAEDITEDKLAHELLEQRVNQRTETLNRKEEELIASKEDAERANLAKSQFLSRMSHELRTPLNAILGFSQLLTLDGDLSKNQQESVNEIQHGGKHLLELINDVLDISKIEARNYEMNRKQVDLRAVLKECVTLSAPLLSQYEVSLSVNDDDLVQADVYADITRLKQIILNLISNACKYNHKDGSIEIEYSNTADNKIHLSVKDTGKGIAKEYQKDIFEPFNRLGAEYGTVEGTGIGLTITKQLIEMMGGNIGFKSEPGQEACFGLNCYPIIQI